MQFTKYLLIALISLTTLAQAQNPTYPNKSVRVIVPFPAGGSADTLMRVVSQGLTKRWNQPIVIDNRPGGGTVIAGSLAAKAPADGYTLLVIANSLTINAKLRSNLPYDPLHAFDPVAMLAHSPQVIAVNNQSPYKSLNDLLLDARSKPGALSYATVGPASTQHIAGEAFKRITNTDFNYISFTGGGLAANAVLGNHVTMVLTNLSEVGGMLESGKLRPLAVTTRERIDSLAQTPTVQELGFKDYEAVVWFALASPAGTPREVVQKISDDLQITLNDPEVKKKLITSGLYPAYLEPQALAKHIQLEFERYSRVIDEAKIKLD
jgi:tripartite-type tricarboxylate transporter receptor subunit TctC